MHGMDILGPTVLLLGAGFLVILLSRLLKTSSIIGFLIAGLLLGPHGFDLIAENETTSLLAELGVVFLLFDIGLHFSMKSVWKKRRDLLVIAPLQLFGSGLIIGLLLAMLFDISAELAVLGGLALALSSTAVVMQVLSDLKQGESPVGQSAKSVIIFQDIAAIFLLIFADSIGNDASSLFPLIGSALLKTVLATAAAVLLGQYILSPLMRVIIKYDDPEMFTILGLLIVMMTGLATAYADLSLTLGAFLAGMVLAETPFRILLQTELRPFRSLLLALFFITVGMIVDPGVIMNSAGHIALLVVVLIVAKALIIGSIMVYFRRPKHHVVQLSVLLGQGSEFALVIFSMGAVVTGMGIDVAQQLIAAIAFSMMFTPILSMLANKYSLEICNMLEDTISNCPDGDSNPVRKQPVFIVGMNEIGKTIARGLRAHDIPYIAVDHDRKRFLEATAAGYIVAYGQTSDLRFWNMLGVSRARAMCITSPRYEVARNIAPVVSKLYPNLKRYAAVKDSADGVRFAALGMVPFHRTGSPSGLEMASAVLKEFGIPEDQVESWAEEEHAAYLETHAAAIEEDAEESAVA